MCHNVYKSCDNCIFYENGCGLSQAALRLSRLIPTHLNLDDLVDERSYVLGSKHESFLLAHNLGSGPDDVSRLYGIVRDRLGSGDQHPIFLNAKLVSAAADVMEMRNANPNAVRAYIEQNLDYLGLVLGALCIGDGPQEYRHMHDDVTNAHRLLARRLENVHERRKELQLPPGVSIAYDVRHRGMIVPLYGISIHAPEGSTFQPSDAVALIQEGLSHEPIPDRWNVFHVERRIVDDRYANDRTLTILQFSQRNVLDMPDAPPVLQRGEVTLTITPYAVRARPTDSPLFIAFPALHRLHGHLTRLNDYLYSDDPNVANMSKKLI
jgi:hypothetical protein